MHIETAFLSLPVAAACWSGSAGAGAWAARRAGTIQPKAFLLATAAVFVAQLSVFDVAVPGTGSSAHFCGGLLLALLLGPAGAVLSMASVLGLQVLLLGDGSLHTFGANLLNMGVLPALLVVPVLLRPQFAHAGAWKRRGLITAAGLLSIGLGGVLQGLEALASGHAILLSPAFTGRLLPLHLAAGLAEGLLTVAALEALAWRPARAPQGA